MKKNNKKYYLNLLLKYQNMNNQDGIKAIKEVLKSYEDKIIQKKIADY